MHDLMRSLEDHSAVPSTFDGDLPEYAFGKATTRIRIGERYIVPDGQGAERPGTLTTATVMEPEKLAFCGISFDDGTSAICTMPLSDHELSAWRQHPETFFGVVGQPHKPLTHALDMYDFFHGSCRSTPKDKLLEALASAPDFAHLATLDQPTLASIHAERLTYGMLSTVKS
jgi:hypothetical protein